MKRIMAFALTLCLLLSLVSPIPVAATQSADLIYKETVERALEEYGKLRFTEQPTVRTGEQHKAQRGRSLCADVRPPHQQIFPEKGDRCEKNSPISVRAS